MKPSRINEQGILECEWTYKGKSEWIPQMCIRARCFNPAKTFCGVDCPLFNNTRIDFTGSEVMDCKELIRGEK